MTAGSDGQAVALLQDLGLKEYEARSFVALTRMTHGTAKQVSDVSTVPRTRVYNAVQVLADKGLVEISHSNPQQFRAVSITEACEILHDEFRTRTETLREELATIEPVDSGTDDGSDHEVWAIMGATAIQTRVQRLIDAADTEVLHLVGRGNELSSEVLAELTAARRRGTEVLVGSVNGLDRHPDLAAADVSVFELSWTDVGLGDGDGTQISRLTLVDDRTSLISTVDDQANPAERAVVSQGRDNGVVALMRRLLSTQIGDKDAIR